MPSNGSWRDEPKSLREEPERALRREGLRRAHMQALAAFTAALREESGESSIPDFDPADGGIGAECLFLLEAPGPRAVASGFVSRNNPDETAKNWWQLNRDAGIERSRTVSWNIVPWYLGADGRIRPAAARDITAGLPHLRRLLALLPQLRVVGLVGRKAGRAEQMIQAWNPALEIVRLAHPSPVHLNRAPGNRGLVLDGLLQVRQKMDAG